MAESNSAPLPEGASSELANKYPCPQCGGILNFDPKSGNLKCPFCGAETPVPKDGETKVEEHSFASFLQQVKAQHWGLELNSVQCQACGAVTQVNNAVTAMNCPFCNHPMVLSNAPTANDTIRPESVLPFQVDSEKLMESLRSWIRSHWFAPGDLVKFWQKQKVNSIYLPYWTFDANTHTPWTAEAGYYYYVRENGQDVRKVRWQAASGERDDFFDDELVCASKGLPLSRLQAIEPFRTSELKPYHSEYLAGHLSERYAIGPQEAWQGALGRMMAKLRVRCAQDVPGDTERNLQIYPQFSDIKIKHTLLPVYIGHYEYNGKSYTFLANGQTGKIDGESPLSWVKVLLTILVLLFLLGFYLWAKGH